MLPLLLYFSKTDFCFVFLSKCSNHLENKIIEICNSLYGCGSPSLHTYILWFLVVDQEETGATKLYEKIMKKKNQSLFLLPSDPQLQAVRCMMIMNSL